MKITIEGNPKEIVTYIREIQKICVALGPDTIRGNHVHVLTIDEIPGPFVSPGIRRTTQE